MQHFARVNGMAAFRHSKQDDGPHRRNRAHRNTERLKDEKTYQQQN